MESSEVALRGQLNVWLKRSLSLYVLCGLCGGMRKMRQIHPNSTAKSDNVYGHRRHDQNYFSSVN